MAMRKAETKTTARTYPKQTLPTPRPARKLTLEEAQRTVAQNHVAAERLAPYDGPVAPRTPKR
ncbi:MAG: hypothetical protein H0X37_24385 [Herpetosiphonaceae bacterium]|nr:hypothetical protein [Herpetosiphonaceae bacterium]